MTIEDAIGKLVLRDMLERQQEEEEGAEGVQMMTMHASKGLEFPSVYIIGFEEEILPHRSSIEADTIEEERRPAYVGITRAKRNLALTFAAKRKQYGEVIDCTPSRFSTSCRPRIWSGKAWKKRRWRSAARGNDALAAMRAMLALTARRADLFRGRFESRNAGAACCWHRGFREGWDVSRRTLQCPDALVGAALACLGAIWLLVLAALDGSPVKIVSVAIYGLSLILLYSISTLYHSLRGRAKVVMRKLDHLSIYLLIAGSYTPFCLVTLAGSWGWTLFGIVWGLAVIGMLQEIKPRSEARVLSLVIYAVMGWIVLVAVAAVRRPGWRRFQLVAGRRHLLHGGHRLFVFDDRFRHWHGIWHIFVMVGSLLHFIAILFYVL